MWTSGLHVGETATRVTKKDVAETAASPVLRVAEWNVHSAKGSFVPTVPWSVTGAAIPFVPSAPSKATPEVRPLFTASPAGDNQQ